MIQLCDHLAGMGGCAVVFVFVQQNGVCRRVLLEELIRRPGLHEGPVFRFVRSPYSDPARTGQQVVVSVHVGQRHLRDHGVGRGLVEDHRPALTSRLLRSAHIRGGAPT